jgi:hypothetical protein
MECEFHSLETSLSLGVVSHVSAITFTLPFADIRFAEKMNIQVYTPDSGPTFFICVIPALQHSGCCSASLPTHHSHFTGARLGFSAIMTTCGAALSTLQYRVVTVVHTYTNI